MDNSSNNYSLEDRLSGITAIGDTHDNIVPIRNAFEYSQKRGNIVFHNGDVVGDYNLLEVGSNLGLKTGMEIVDGFMQENLSQQDYQTYMTFQEIQQVGGYENYIGLIQQNNNFSIEQMQQLNENLMKIIEYGQSELFQKRMFQLEQKFQHEKEDELIENQIRYNALYEVILQEQGKNLADLLNEYSNVEMLFNEGNHDSRGFIDNYVRIHLKNKNQVTVLNDQVGYVDANGLNIAGMTNSAGRIINVVRMALSPDMVAQYFSHVDYGISEAVLLNGKKTEEEIKNLEDIIKQDNEFNRLTNNGQDLENKTLDILATHAPYGEGQMYSAVAAYLGLYSQLSVASDTHRTKEGENMFGGKMINTGTKMTDIYKDKNGNIVYEMIDIGIEQQDTYEGYKGYDVNYLKQRVDDVYKLMKAQYEQVIAQQEQQSLAKAA